MKGVAQPVFFMEAQNFVIFFSLFYFLQRIQMPLSVSIPFSIFPLTLPMPVISEQLIHHSLFNIFIRILPGDTVVVEMSPYDLNRGRIVLRQ